MEETQVYAASCPDYGQAEACIRTLVEQMGGMGRFVRPGERIVLKANLLRAAPPESAICTHPAVVEAVARLVKEAGGTPVICDSAAGGQNKQSVPRSLSEKTGRAAAPGAAGAELSMDSSTRTVSLPEGKVLRQAEIITPVAEADGVIDLCKMKTHVLMSMTGAVKNLFGVIPGLSKVGYHATHPDHATFADVLLDLTGYVKPRLSLMDGILAMEGDGPGSSGTPRQAGLLLAAANPLALDTAAGAIMNLPRKDNPVLLAAERRGLTPCRMEDVELIGGTVEELRMADYKFPASTKSNLMDFLGPLARPAERLCKKALSQTPRIDGAKCVGCGICAKSCPGQAIAMTAPGKKARISQKACIHCYCCHELCPQKAVELHQSWLGRLLTK